MEECARFAMRTAFSFGIVVFVVALMHILLHAPRRVHLWYLKRKLPHLANARFRVQQLRILIVYDHMTELRRDVDPNLPHYERWYDGETDHNAYVREVCTPKH